ncbi:hypothetical protein [Vibrio fluminensis]|nr:hypothetical protein [Vibrio fluminensis]
MTLRRTQNPFAKTSGLLTEQSLNSINVQTILRIVLIAMALDIVTL